MFLGLIAAVNEKTSLRKWCCSDWYNFVTDKSKPILIVVFIRFLEVDHCFMWARSPAPHSSNRLACLSLQVSLSIYNIFSPLYFLFLLRTCLSTVNAMAWLKGLTDGDANGSLLIISVRRYGKLCTHGCWPGSKQDVPSEEQPATKQDATEVQWDLSWMEMSNLLDKELYRGT